MTPRLARGIVGLGLPAVIAAVGLVPLVALRDRLPARVASHYDFSGTPDDSMTVAQFAVVCGVLVAVGLAMLIAMATSSHRMPKPMAPLMTFVGAFVAGLGAMILATTVVTQRGLSDWRDATNGALTTGLVVASGAAFGALAAYPASALPHAAEAGTTTATPPMDLAPGQHAVWVSTLHSVWMQRSGVAFLVAGVASGILVHPFAAFVLGPAALAFLALATLRVRVDADGVEVRYGLLTFPRTHIAIERIERASAIDVRPLEWGGWGYRGSVSLMRQAAVVLRKGPGLRLDLVDGRVFVVTIDGPEVPASLLNAEVERRIA